MNLSASIFLLGGTVLLAACTTLSEAEQHAEVALQTESAEPQLDPAAEYEKAQKECAEKGGEWVTTLHMDGLDRFANSLRCWSRDDPRRRPGDGRWKEEGLLPYDVTVSYGGGTGRVIGFVRKYQRIQEKPEDGKQKTPDGLE